VPQACPWDGAGAVQIVTDWANLGISTYVIGLPGMGGIGDPGAGGGGLAGLLGGLGLAPPPDPAADPAAGGGVGGTQPLADGLQVLNDLAQAGGTDQFITPSDPAALEAKLQSIVSETVKTGFNTCTINLTPAAEAPEKLLMIVEEPGMPEKQQVPRDFGWAINGAGNQVNITGQLCEQAMGGRFSSITFEYGCPDVPPPPPIPPLE